MLSPLPTQITGAKFLADRQAALLADEPRVGKTGAAIMAADDNLEEKLLIVTTASGRSVWRRALPLWSPYGRQAQVLTNGSTLDPKIPCAIVGWPSISEPKLRAQLLRRKWDRLILDESHYAKAISTKRTQAAYGDFLQDGRIRVGRNALSDAAGGRVWCLSGTPLPNAPNDLYPMMRALCPERLVADTDKGWTDVTTYPAFLKRYCVTKPKKIGNWRWIDVVIGGRNLDELKARLDGFVLRRTQADVGIREPIFETYPLTISDRVRREVEGDLDERAILAAAEAGDTRSLEQHLGAIRRVTGEIKARAVVEAVKEEMECGLDKIVLMRWHKEVGAIIRDGLSQYGVVSVDGSTSPRDRQIAEERFRDDPTIRVFDGQIAAAGEAIDLSAAAVLMFVETSFVPKDMKQAALRVTNHTQKRQAFVRVAVLEGSIDEALQTVLLRKWSAIREVLTNAS